MKTFKTGSKLFTFKIKFTIFEIKKLGYNQNYNNIEF